MSKRHRPRPTKELSQVSYSRIDRNSDYFSYSYYLCFVVSLRSNNLTHLQKYSSRQFKLLNLITYLHEQKGMGYRKIASYLNESGIKTQRGKTFSNSSVHSVLKRYKQRVARIKEVREVKFTKKITNFRISSIHESDDYEST